MIATTDKKLIYVEQEQVRRTEDGWQVMLEIGYARQPERADLGGIYTGSGQTQAGAVAAVYAIAMEDILSELATGY